MASEGKKKTDDKKKRPKHEITPEYIAEQRALREKRKAEKRKAQEEAGILPVQPEEEMNLDFIKRPLLQVAQSVPSRGVRIKLMTYNVLAQCLIRRELFPENGDALKWKWRSKVLASEISYYNPDIICLQEVDKDKVEAHWRPKFKKMGLSMVFSTLAVKPHGNIIAYRDSMFDLVGDEMINYDDLIIPDAPRQIESRNTGVFVTLFNKTIGKKIIVGTTHLFWHPVGSYERTRQMSLFLRRSSELADQNPGSVVLLAGDFNSECFDGPYMYATGKSVEEKSETFQIMENSAAHVFTRGLMEGFNDPSEESEDGTSVDNAAGRKKIKALAEYFNSTPAKFISTYGMHYSSVHPENVHPKSTGEPVFSNWAHSWRGLLDYIFVLQTEKPSDNTQVTVTQLLRLPSPKEMGPEPSGQPRLGQYPSDHLSMMAELTVSDEH